MARPQTELQALLEGLPGVTDAYFQKPLNTQLKEPYIVYDLSGEYVSSADNKPYAFWNRYTVTVVHRDPDSPIPGLLRGLPHARFDRRFVAAGLHHTVYILHF